MRSNGELSPLAFAWNDMLKNMPVARLILFSLSPQETRQIGENLGRCLSAGQIIALTGDLGAGKTCLVQGMARGLQVQDRYITSPTFTIINEYRGVLPLYHFDVYRLSGPDELEELGYEEYFYGEGVCIIEWSERIEELLPEEYLKITLEYGGVEIRKLSLQAQGEKTRRVLARFRSRFFSTK